MLCKIVEFWSYFGDNHDKITRKNVIERSDITNQLTHILSTIDPSLTFECDFPEGKNKQFFLSADGIDDAFKILNHVYNYKTDIDGWDFIKYRQPTLPLDKACFTYIGFPDIASEEETVNFHEILFTLEEHASRGAIVNFFIPNYQKDNEEHEVMRWVVLDNCIGEYSAVKRIALYNTFPISEAPKEAKSILVLKSDLDELKLKYIKNFWSFFLENHTDIFHQDKESHFFDQLEDKLFSINHDLTFVIYEKNSDSNNKSELELTSDGIEEAFEDIELLYQYKPEIEKWSFYKYSRPEQDSIDGLFSDVLFSLSDLSDDKYTIRFFMPELFSKLDDLFPELSENDDKEFFVSRTVAWMILRRTLGEYDATKKFLYQCYPLEQSELFQFGDKKPKSLLHLNYELSKKGFLCHLEKSKV